MKQLSEVVNGEMHLNMHAGQLRAYDSMKRIICILAGTQSGKTSFGPFWLLKEIASRGSGDYIVAAPTFKMLSLKLFPEFLKLFDTTCKLGAFTGSGSFQSRFLFSSYGCKVMFGHVPKEPTQIFFGHAQDPDSLESATAKAAWLDEAGQKKFRLGSYEAIRRRLSINMGRILITTTPYCLGWLKDIIFDPWKKASLRGESHPLIDVIQFKSTENPSFPMEEYEATKLTLPAWKHKMFYDGEFDRPAGAVWEDYDAARHTCPRFAVPDEWPRHLGLDFGGVHTAGVFFAKGRREGVDDKDKYFAYREYPERGLWGSATASVHVSKLLKGEPSKPKAVGGAGSEDQWREEFRAGGLFVHEPPIREVDVGIDRCTEMFKKDEVVFFDDLHATLDQVQNYSYEVDEHGNPTGKIEDKETYHLVDAFRYFASHVKGPRKAFWIK